MRCQICEEHRKRYPNGGPPGTVGHACPATIECDEALAAWIMEMTLVVARCADHCNVDTGPLRDAAADLGSYLGGDRRSGDDNG